MTQKELLVIIDSWENLQVMVDLVSKKQEHYKLLIETALHDNSKHSWRAAYLVDKINDVHPGLLLPYIDAIIHQLKKEKDSSKKRHFLKLISQSSIAEKHFSFLIDYCINTLTSEKEPIAVRVHAMQVLYNISENETDLKPELLMIIEHEMEFHATPGILTRGRKLTQRLRKQIQ
ncbi:MAG: hypothetical protein R2757_03875 [Draconibacterium sp.]